MKHAATGANNGSRSSRIREISGLALRQLESTSEGSYL